MGTRQQQQQPMAINGQQRAANHSPSSASVTTPPRLACACDSARNDDRTYAYHLLASIVLALAVALAAVTHRISLSTIALAAGGAIAALLTPSDSLLLSWRRAAVNHLPAAANTVCY